jgi:hypothetical protein
MAQLQTLYPTGVCRHVIDGFLEQQGIGSGYNDTALTDPGDDSYWPLSWGCGAGSLGLVGLVSILAEPPIGRLVDRLGPDRIVLAGVICAGAGVLLLWALPQIFAIDPQARSRISGQLFLSANWSGWGWNDTYAFALLLVVLAVLIEHSSWGRFLPC